MKNKSDADLLGTSYLSNEIKVGTEISWDYPIKLGYFTLFPSVIFPKNGRFGMEVFPPPGGIVNIRWIIPY
jgi:hypothetical protein